MKPSLLSASLIFLMSAGGSRAQEPPLPKSAGPLPTTAYGQISSEGSLTLWLLETEKKAVPVTVKVYKEVEKKVDGNIIKEKVAFDETVYKEFQAPKAWRKVPFKLDPPSVGFFDTKGQPVPKDKARELLSKVTPVLVSPGYVGDFPLLTVKEDTLVLAVPGNILYPPPSGGLMPPPLPPAAAPRVPTAPAPPIPE